MADALYVLVLIFSLELSCLLMNKSTIGLWGAASILTNPLPNDCDDYVTFRAFSFLKEAADKGLCSIWGYQGHESTRSKVSIESLRELEFDVLAHNGTDLEPADASLIPRVLYSDDNDEKTFSRIRFDKLQINELSRTFIDWLNNKCQWIGSYKNSIELIDSTFKNEEIKLFEKKILNLQYWHFWETLIWVHTRNINLLCISLYNKSKGFPDLTPTDISASIGIDTGIFIPSKSNKISSGIRFVLVDNGAPSCKLDECLGRLIRDLQNNKIKSIYKSENGREFKLTDQTWKSLTLDNMSETIKVTHNDIILNLEDIQFSKDEVLYQYPNLKAFSITSHSSINSLNNTRLDFSDLISTIARRQKQLDKVFSKLCALLQDGSLKVDAEIHKTRQTPVPNTNVSKYSMDFPEYSVLDRNWWLNGIATIDLRGRLNFDATHLPVMTILRFFIQQLSDDLSERLQLVLNLRAGSRSKGEETILYGARNLTVSLRQAKEYFPLYFKKQNRHPKRGRKRNAREQVKQVLLERYPRGIPSECTHEALLEEVDSILKNLNLQKISMSTLIRARKEIEKSFNT